MNLEDKEIEELIKTLDQSGRYYNCHHFGYGANEAEVIRQNLIADTLIKIKCNDCAADPLDLTLCPTHERIWDQIERLAELAEATCFTYPDKLVS